jgi:hypothetical protein
MSSATLFCDDATGDDTVPADDWVPLDDAGDRSYIMDATIAITTITEAATDAIANFMRRL